MTNAIEGSVAMLLSESQRSPGSEDWTALSERSLVQARRRAVRQRASVALIVVLALCAIWASLWRVFGPAPITQAADPTFRDASTSNDAVPRLGQVLPDFAAVFVPRLLIVSAVVAGFVLVAARFRKKRVARPLGTLSKVLIGMSLTLVSLVAAWVGAIDVWFVASESMAPTLRVEDRLWVDESDTDVERGDVVLFVADDGVVPAGGHRLLRIVAVAGDEVEGSNGRVLINGKASLWSQPPFVSPSFEPVTLGADQLFVVGDNGPSSLDSRITGAISTNQVRGTVRAIIWSPNR